MINSSNVVQCFIYKIKTASNGNLSCYFDRQYMAYYSVLNQSIQQTMVLHFPIFLLKKSVDVGVIREQCLSFQSGIKVDWRHLSTDFPATIPSVMQTRKKAAWKSAVAGRWCSYANATSRYNALAWKTRTRPINEFLSFYLFPMSAPRGYELAINLYFGII